MEMKYINFIINYLSIVVVLITPPFLCMIPYILKKETFQISLASTLALEIVSIKILAIFFGKQELFNIVFGFIGTIGIIIIFLDILKNYIYISYMAKGELLCYLFILYLLYI